MTPQTSSPPVAAAAHGGRLRRMMQAWRARTPEQRRAYRFAAMLGLLALALDVGAVTLGLRLWREATLGSVLAEGLPFAPGIRTMQAVLRDDPWLGAHVLTVIGASVTFALAWSLGNLNLVLVLASPRREALLRTFSDYCYRMMQMGVLLLAAGMLLGACWSAGVRGRFWDWNPEEVWALAVLGSYLMPLLARQAGWLGPRGLAVSAVVCFASVVLAWYAVNFLGTGLHASASGGGVTLWILWAGLCNAALVAHGSAQLASLPGRKSQVAPTGGSCGHAVS